MPYLLLAIFVLVTAIPWFRGTSPKILHPLNVYVIMQIALIVPGVLIALNDVRTMDARVVNSVGGDFNSAMSWALLMLIVLNACVYVAFYFWRARQQVIPRDAEPLAEQPYDSYVYLAGAVGIMLVMFIAKAWFAGGADYLLSNLSNRVELLRGAGPFAIVEQGSRLLACFLALRMALLRKTPLAWMILAGVAGLSFILGGIFGSRKSALDILVLLGMGMSFYSARFFLASPRNIVALAAAYVALVLLLFVGLIYRNSDAQVDFAYVLQSSWFDIKTMLTVESYIETYYFVANYFDPNNYYYWSILGDLKTMFVPSSMVPDKAITDDGIYIKHAVKGIMLPPQTPVQLVVLDSMPPETMGAAYMNGGPLVVPVYGLILGSVFAFFIRQAEKHPNGPLWFILTVYVFTTFELSNLRLAQLITLSVSLLIVRMALKPLEAAALPRLRGAY